MGYATAAEFSDSVEQGLTTLDSALSHHLTANHYPPLPTSLIPVAKRVIAQANKGNWNAKVRLPKGISFRGSSLAPVSECIRAWHLEAFLRPEEN